MIRTPASVDPAHYPPSLRTLLLTADLYDSHCRSGAEVLFIDRDNGYFLKSMPAGALQTEAELTRFFSSLSFGSVPLAAEVLAFETFEGRDFLLTSRVRGEDGTSAVHLADPIRLTDTFAEILRALHELPTAGCPVQNRLLSYRALALQNYESGNYDKESFPDSFGYRSAEEALSEIRANGEFLTPDTLIHGDYCLPNILFEDFRFSGFVDVGNGGIGDRHIDLFWALWTLWYNLGKTDRYTGRFLDAYGRDQVNEQKLRTVAAFEVFG